MNDVKGYLRGEPKVNDFCATDMFPLQLAADRTGSRRCRGRTRCANAPSAAERVTRLGGQLQDWEIEVLAAVGRPAARSDCQHHPNSNPLESVLSESRAVCR